MRDEPTYRSSLIDKIENTIDDKLIEGLSIFFRIKNSPQEFNSENTYTKGDIVYWGGYKNKDSNIPADYIDSLVYVTVADEVVKPPVEALQNTSLFLLIGSALLSEIFNNNIFKYNNQSVEVRHTPAILFYYDPNAPLRTIGDQWYQEGIITARIVFSVFTDREEQVSFPSKIASYIFGITRTSWISFFEQFAAGLIEFTVSSKGDFKQITLENSQGNNKVDTFQFTIDFNYRVDRFKYYNAMAMQGISVPLGTRSLATIKEIITNTILI